ncbi:MAG: hypothetical protein KDA57_20650, partial [Planctomycetales bacterium]|nr:hypothetical protein [Planctomycetales bacterium]
LAAAREAAGQRRQAELARKSSARELITQRAQQSAMERRARLAQRATGAVMNLEGQVMQAAMQGNPAAIQMLGMIANNRNALADRELRRMEMQNRFELGQQQNRIAGEANAGEAAVRAAQAKNLEAQTNALDLESKSNASDAAIAKASSFASMGHADAARYISGISGAGGGSSADDFKAAGITSGALLSRLKDLDADSNEYKTFVKALKEMGVSDADIKAAGHRRTWGEFGAAAANWMGGFAPGAGGKF